MIKNIYFIGVALMLSFCMKKEGPETIASNKAIALDSNSKAAFSMGSKQMDYDQYYKEALLYCQKNNLNQKMFILIDLGVHSGLKRFFVYDFKKNKTSRSFLVSHGCGDAAWGETATKEKAQVSNQPDSHCSSIGKYVVLNRGVSQWGIKVNYMLEGKEKTNSNAMRRAIVLHSWEEIPSVEVYPKGTPEGWGCPAISNESMKQIDEILLKNKKVLLWIVKT